MSFEFDQSHFRGTPPLKVVKGVFEADPGTYDLRFLLGGDGSLFAEPVRVTVDASGAQAVEVVILKCKGTTVPVGEQTAFVRAEFKEEHVAAFAQGNPRFIRYRCV